MHVRYNSWYIFLRLLKTATGKDQILRCLENVNANNAFNLYSEFNTLLRIEFRYSFDSEETSSMVCRYLLAYLVNIWCVRILRVVCTRLCIFK